MPISIARRYARALHAVSREAGEVDAALSTLEALAEAIGTSEALAEVIENPQVTRAQRAEVLLAVAREAGATPLFENFLRLLAERDRAGEVPQIARLFRDLADESAGRVRAELTSALPLPDEQVARLKAALTEVTGKTIVLSQHEDPALIGGVVAKVGDTLYDGSFKTQLERLRARALA
jgi:F-type H+-transporting ATPase subunit delta